MKETASNELKLAGKSDAAVEKATGRSWSEWIRLLDGHQAEILNHPGIVKVLSGYLDNAWWCQSVAVGYEQYKGKRVTGQTADRKFQIGVSKTFNVPKDVLWELLIAEDGMEIWLGKMVPEDTGDPRTYRTEDGIEGEITVMKPGSHCRMSWKPAEWDEKSTLQVRVLAKGEKTTLTFHHEGLPSAADRDRMKTHWSSKLSQLANLLEQPSH